MKRLILIGCVKSKRVPPSKTVHTKSGESYEIPGRVPVVELYDSPLWGDYDRNVRGGAWPWELSQRISTGIARIVGTTEGRVATPLVIEVHAGAPYVQRVRDAMAWARFGVQVDIEHPVAGMQIGEQLAWYNSLAEPAQLELGVA